MGPRPVFPFFVYHRRGTLGLINNLYVNDDEIDLVCLLGGSEARFVTNLR